jgi:GH35 family endo-1,4-beta-xylanase
MGKTKMKRERLLINISHLLAFIMLFSVFAETASALQGTVQLLTTATLTKLGDGSYQATVNVSNNGTSAAQDVVFSTASLGSAAGTSALQAVGNIPAGGVASTVFTFPASAGASGAAVVERYAGSYNGGTFGGSIRAVLPASPELIAQLNNLIAQAVALEAGNREFPLQISHAGNGSDVNKAFPWVSTAELKGLDDALQIARNALIQWNAQAIATLQSAIATFTGAIKADGTDPYFRLDPGPGQLPVTITAPTNVWTAHTPPLDSRVPADFDGSTFQVIPYPFADSQGQAPVLQINYVYKGKATFGGVSMQSPLSPTVNVPAGATIEFDVYYPLSAQGKLMRWRIRNRSTDIDSYLRDYDYAPLNPAWVGSYNGDTWLKTHVSVNATTGTSSNFILELQGETGRPAETATVIVQNFKITEPDPTATPLPSVVNSQNESVVAPIKSLYSRDNSLFMVGAIGTGAVTGTRARHYEIFVDGNNLKPDATHPRGPNWLTSVTGAALSGATTTPGVGEYSFPDSAYTSIRDSGTPGQYKIHGHNLAWYNQAPAWMTQITPATLPSGYTGTPFFYGLGNGVTTQVLVSPDMARRVQFNHAMYVMRHFSTTSTKYGSSVSRGVVLFNSWDVLNEEVHESRHSINIPLDPNSWRSSLKQTNWLVAMSDDLIGGDLKDHYIYLLFKHAHIAVPNAQMAAAFKANYASLPQYMKLDGHDDGGSIDAYVVANPPRLTYNDYDYATHTKARTVYNMVLALNTAWLSDPLYDGRPLIELIGSEGHDAVGSTLASDNQYALAMFASLVDRHLLTGVSWSEFDLVMPTDAPGGGATAPAALNIRQSDALGYEYAMMYRLFTKFSPYMDHIISWGVSGSGWQGSYVLFDGNSNADSGYYGAMNPNRYVLGHSYLDSYFSGEYDKLQDGYEIDLGDLGIYKR